MVRHLEEIGKQPVQVLRRNAAAIIGYGDHETVFMLRHMQADPAAFGRELECVAQQVEEYFVQLLPVKIYGRLFHIMTEGRFDMAAQRKLPETGINVFQEWKQVLLRHM